MKVYEALASAVLSSCTPNELHRENWEDKAERLTKELMPSGSGVDSGTKLLWEKMHSKGKWNGKLVFKADFHHMDENGYYDGWTEHVVTVKPHLVFDLTVTISGSDRNMIKDFLRDLFYCVLTAVYEPIKKEKTT